MVVPPDIINEVFKKLPYMDMHISSIVEGITKLMKLMNIISEEP
jgi:hypothetical protein